MAFAHTDGHTRQERAVSRIDLKLKRPAVSGVMRAPLTAGMEV